MLSLLMIVSAVKRLQQGVVVAFEKGNYNWLPGKRICRRDYWGGEGSA